MRSTRILNADTQVLPYLPPTPGIDEYQRSTKQLKNEAVTGIISDNSTCPRIANRINRSFNTTGSKSTIDRWKHQAADKLSFKETISKLNFSGILCIDEYKPKRASGYDLIDSVSKTSRILYLEKAYGSGRGIVKEHFAAVKTLGINPWAIIFNMRACFPKAAKTVFGKILLFNMTTFLDHPKIPRSGNPENVIRTWRQIEKVRYSFKSDKGRIDHLKLYQVSKYL